MILKGLMYFIFVGLLNMIPFNIISQETEINNYKVYYPENTIPKSVCFVIHGLNNKPSSMLWIIDELLSQESIVVNAELWGHGNSPIPITDSTKLEERVSQFKQVTWSQWMIDVKPAIDFIDSICKKNDLPKYFFGFSLGGLVGVSIGPKYNFEFDGYFLLAPAIKIRNLPKLSIGLMSPFPNKVIKSRTPLAYRENRGTPVAAYKAMLKGVKEFNKANPYLNNCIIIVDKKDRVVSAKKLSRYAKENNYSIEIIRKNKKVCTYCGIPHLIIDEASLGPSSELVSGIIESFFSNVSK